MPSSVIDAMPRICRLAVLGPGLLGGSVARAVKERGLADRVCLWARRQEAVEEIIRLGLCDEVSTDLESLVAGADFVVIATPVGVIGGLAARILKADLHERAVVTDVGSVKAPVVEEMRTIFHGAKARFVGSHPMAGAERQGIEASRADLFEGAACILTPDPEQRDEAALKTVSAFWQRLGCRIFDMSPQDHDATAASISHVPHVAAAALVLEALGTRDTNGRLVGRGFVDTTRVASGSPELWKEILLENRDSVIASLGGLRKNLQHVLDLLEEGDGARLEQYLREAKDLRDACLSSGDWSDPES